MRAVKLQGRENFDPQHTYNKKEIASIRRSIEAQMRYKYYQEIRVRLSEQMSKRQPTKFQESPVLHKISSIAQIPVFRQKSEEFTQQIHEIKQKIESSKLEIAKKQEILLEKQNCLQQIIQQSEMLDKKENELQQMLASQFDANLDLEIALQSSKEMHEYEIAFNQRPEDDLISQESPVNSLNTPIITPVTPVAPFVASKPSTPRDVQATGSFSTKGASIPRELFRQPYKVHVPRAGIKII